MWCYSPLQHIVAAGAGAGHLHYRGAPTWHPATNDTGEVLHRVRRPVRGRRDCRGRRTRPRDEIVDPGGLLRDHDEDLAASTSPPSRRSTRCTARRLRPRRRRAGALGVLTEGIERLQSETDARAEAAGERSGEGRCARRQGGCQPRRRRRRRRVRRRRTRERARRRPRTEDEEDDPKSDAHRRPEALAKAGQVSGSTSRPALASVRPVAVAASTPDPRVRSPP